MASSGGWPDSPPVTFAARCPGCSESAIIEVVAEWDLTPGPEDAWEPHNWTVGKCQSCASPSLLISEWDQGEWSSGWSPRRQVWPETARSLPGAVPKPIRDTYDEAQRCLTVSSYTGAALLARRVVEGICAHLNAQGRTLHDKLQFLKDDGVLDERLHQWSSLVKDIGNEGAHDTSDLVTREDAEEVLSFVEALLDYLYVYRMRFEAFVTRRERLKQGLPPLEPIDLSALSGSSGKQDDSQDEV